MGLLRGKVEDFSSPLAGVPARLYCGYFFLKYGLQKATSGFDGESLRLTVTEWAKATPYQFYAPLLTDFVIPYASVCAVLVIIGEIAVGATLLVGFATRLSALVGLILSLNYLFGSGVPLLSVEEPVVFSLLCMSIYAIAPGRSLGLDAALKGILPRWVA